MSVYFSPKNSMVAIGNYIHSTAKSSLHMAMEFPPIKEKAKQFESLMAKKTTRIALGVIATVGTAVAGYYAYQYLRGSSPALPLVSGNPGSENNPTSAPAPKTDNKPAANDTSSTCSWLFFDCPPASSDKKVVVIDPRPTPVPTPISDASIQTTHTNDVSKHIDTTEVLPLETSFASTALKIGGIVIGLYALVKGANFLNRTNKHTENKPEEKKKTGASIEPKKKVQDTSDKPFKRDSSPSPHDDTDKSSHAHGSAAPSSPAKPDDVSSGGGSAAAGKQEKERDALADAGSKKGSSDTHRDDDAKASTKAANATNDTAALGSAAPANAAKPTDATSSSTSTATDERERDASADAGSKSGSSDNHSADDAKAGDKQADSTTGADALGSAAPSSPAKPDDVPPSGGSADDDVRKSGGNAAADAHSNSGSTDTNRDGDTKANGKPPAASAPKKRHGKKKDGSASHATPAATSRLSTASSTTSTPVYTLPQTTAAVLDDVAHGDGESMVGGAAAAKPADTEAVGDALNTDEKSVEPNSSETSGGNGGGNSETSRTPAQARVASSSINGTASTSTTTEMRPAGFSTPKNASGAAQHSVVSLRKIVPPTPTRKKQMETPKQELGNAVDFHNSPFSKLQISSTVASTPLGASVAVPSTPSTPYDIQLDATDSPSSPAATLAPPQTPVSASGSAGLSTALKPTTPKISWNSYETALQDRELSAHERGISAVKNSLIDPIKANAKEFTKYVKEHFDVKDQAFNDCLLNCEKMVPFHRVFFGDTTNLETYISELFSESKRISKLTESLHRYAEFSRLLFNIRLLILNLDKGDANSATQPSTPSTYASPDVVSSPESIPTDSQKASIKRDHGETAECIKKTYTDLFLNKATANPKNDLPVVRFFKIHYCNLCLEFCLLNEGINLLDELNHTSLSTLASQVEFFKDQFKQLNQHVEKLLEAKVVKSYEKQIEVLKAFDAEELEHITKITKIPQDDDVDASNSIFATVKAVVTTKK